MMSGAVHTDHFGHGEPFTGKAFLFRVHSFLYQLVLDAVTADPMIQQQAMLVRLYVEHHDAGRS